MRVALLTKEYPPEVYGGAGVHVGELSRELAKLIDLDVHCFGRERSDPLVKKSYGAWEEFRSSIPDGPAATAFETMAVDLAMLANMGKVDICHSHTWYTNFAGFMARQALGYKHIATSHSLEPLRPWKREQLDVGYDISLWIERSALTDADAVIAVSGAMKNDIISCYPDIDPDKVHVIYNGVDTLKWRPKPWSGSLERFGVNPNKQIVAFLGRITRQKGLSYLLKAAPLIDRSAQIVICAGQPDTKEIREEVHALFNSAAGREGSLIIIEEVLPVEELSELFTKATCLVCPSIYEPFGLVNIEAMACSAPVVASDVGGIKEIVDDGQTGYLVPVQLSGVSPFEPVDGEKFAADIAEKVNFLVSEPDTVKKMREKARSVVEEKFSWSEIAKQTFLLYQNVLQSGK